MNQNFVFEGRTPLSDFYRVIEIEGDDFEESKGDADTLAGFLLLEISGKFPERNETIERLMITRIQD
jgi:putative hemolysin